MLLARCVDSLATFLQVAETNWRESGKKSSYMFWFSNDISFQITTETITSTVAVFASVIIIRLFLCRSYKTTKWKGHILHSQPLAITHWIGLHPVLLQLLILSITKCSIVIDFPRAYLSRNRRAITWVSNYMCPIWTFSNRTCNWIPTWFSRQSRSL